VYKIFCLNTQPLALQLHIFFKNIQKCLCTAKQENVLFSLLQKKVSYLLSVRNRNYLNTEFFSTKNKAIYVL
jgi:hypothetical protein